MQWGNLNIISKKYIVTKKNQVIIIELKYTIIEIKKLLDTLNNRVKMKEDRWMN